MLLRLSTAFLVAVHVTSALAQESPESTLEQLAVADGLEVSLFAAEPDLRNPTSMDVDAEGRIWVTEAVNYRLFNQPIADERGDRIRVLEDTDGDGRCDKAWTFYQDPSLQSPMGITVLGDRVYVCQAPDLFYLRDTDGDGVADEKTVVLTGFEGVDHDHAIHGVVFGADGWLYMSNGDRGLDVTDKSGHRVHAGRDAPLQAATVLRSDLEGYHLEALADNMRNPYEPAVDSFGTVYISDNDDDGNEQTRINYVMEGGDYGYWPRRKGDRRLDAVHWNEDRPGTVPKMIRTGFGSPTGLLVYEGTHLPARFRGALIHADAGPGEIRAFHTQGFGAGFSATKELLLSSADDWFRPSDVCVAPDGSLFVADWYDAGVGGHRMADTAAGRVYRIARTGAEYHVPPLDLSSEAGLRAAFLSPNIARRYLAYTELKARLEDGDSRLLQTLWREGDEIARARALWLLGADPSRGAEVLDEAKSDPSTNLRTQAVRMLSSLGPARFQAARPFLDDPDPAVRRQILVELAKLDEADHPWVLDWLHNLQMQFDGRDRFYREALGIAMRGRESWAFDRIQSLYTSRPWDLRMAGLAFQYHPPQALETAMAAVNDENLPLDVRIASLRAVEAVSSESAGSFLTAKAVGEENIVLRQVAQQLLARDNGDAWREVLSDETFLDSLERKVADPILGPEMLVFTARLGVVQTLPVIARMASDNDAGTEVRRVALGVVADLASRAESQDRTAIRESLVRVLYEEDSLLATKAVAALANLGGDDSYETLRTYIAETGNAKARRQTATRELARRKSGALLLLNMAERNMLPADLHLLVSDLSHGSRYEDVRLLAQTVLPREVSQRGEALPPMEALVAMEGNMDRGRAVFFDETRTQCARCHKIGDEGGIVGPGLAKIGEKLSRQALFESILVPDAAIAHEYRVEIVRTKSRGYLSGYVRSEDDENLELMEASGEAIRVAKSDIVERYPSEASLMPTGLSLGMSQQELVDLVAFLERQE